MKGVCHVVPLNLCTVHIANLKPVSLDILERRRRIGVEAAKFSTCYLFLSTEVAFGRRNPEITAAGVELQREFLGRCSDRHVDDIQYYAIRKSSRDSFLPPHKRSFC